MDLLLANPCLHGQLHLLASQSVQDCELHLGIAAI